MPTSSAEQDVVDILTTDHHEVLTLIEQIPGTIDAEQRRDMADTIIAELMRHAVAEEMYVYPAVREHLADGDEQVEHDVKEHQELEELMKQLEGADAAKAEFLEVLAKLTDVLRDHVSDEEDEQFPALRAAVPHEQLVEIGAKVETAKKVAPTRPHPAAPHSALFHKALGPGVGFVDRLRDTLTGRAKNT